MQKRARLRELGFVPGQYQPGPFNAITDVPGVLVGTKTVIRDSPTITRSGVTAIVPRNGAVHEDYPFAGFFSFNGIGEMTGLALINEWGVLTSPVVFTNTGQVGMAWDALSKYGTRKYGGFTYKLPVVAETYDGYLSDMDAFPLTAQDVEEALETAGAGPVAEGNTGGGTGMICHAFKGGTGTASRIVQIEDVPYTIGALVQANHGTRHQLRVDGVPVGRLLNSKQYPGLEMQPEGQSEVASSSILVALATDAPLLPHQCKRLARRATVGMARTGGIGMDTSGDLFLAFATGNHYLPTKRSSMPLTMLHNHLMDPIMEAAVEAVEEAILNALTAAETMQGRAGRTVHALPLDELVKLMAGYPYAGKAHQPGEED